MTDMVPIPNYGTNVTRLDVVGAPPTRRGAVLTYEAFIATIDAPRA